MTRPASMKVLLTADTVGGVWTYAMDLARALAVEGVEVSLATMGALPSREQRGEATSIEGLELHESAYRLPWMAEPWDDVRSAGEWLLDLETRVAPHVVHVNEPVHAALPWNVPVVAVGHSCVVSWWHAVLKVAPPATWNRYRAAMADGLGSADAVVAPSCWMLEELQKHYGLVNGRVIPNGRQAPRPGPENKGPVVFAAGRVWDPAKNLMMLEHVAEGLSWPVYVAGDPQNPDGDQPLAGRHIHLLGKLSTSEVAAWLRQASIYAFPARYEPFGLSVTEAALAGCALVLGDLPTLREQWDGRAVFVEPDDPATLRLAIESLIANADLRQALAMRARRHALTLTPRRMALAYLGLYSELVAQRTSSLEVPACAS